MQRVFEKAVIVSIAISLVFFFRMVPSAVLDLKFTGWEKEKALKYILERCGHGDVLEIYERIKRVEKGNFLVLMPYGCTDKMRNIIWRLNYITFPDHSYLLPLTPAGVDDIRWWKREKIEYLFLFTGEDAVFIPRSVFFKNLLPVVMHPETLSSPPLIKWKGGKRGIIHVTDEHWSLGILSKPFSGVEEVINGLPLPEDMWERIPEGQRMYWCIFSPDFLHKTPYVPLVKVR
ncbi:hypothetical protein DRQ18_05780 [bacterium]|nr:MAG: hypothetical protein DRQ18_05780 [bacterium]